MVDHLPLPIDSILDELLKTVADSPNVVLQAPPGAGKTTKVPLALLEAPLLGNGRILMLEPRRIAASYAAHRMAALLGERTGETVGYTTRFERRVSPGTRVEVVTEGILTRRLQNDPCLEGTAMVIFDEFHERSLQADLALALCLEVQREVRPDLRILVMSATLDGGPVAALLGNAPILTSTGRVFPVEVRYLENAEHGRLPDRMCAAVRLALGETEGDILAFLPGAQEIRACAASLESELRERGIAVCGLYGDLPLQEQEKAIQPSSMRKVVLATNIAETSLTIEGVRVIIDSGLSRTVRHNPGNGMNSLVTVRESRSSAEQRKGRAGRLAPGICYRLFGRHTFDAMTPFPQPEINVADLSPLLLELSVWGVHDPGSLSWLDPPPDSGLSAARALLFDLGAIDGNGLPTERGRKMAEFPVHPRLARMLIRGIELGVPKMASALAALLAEKDIFRFRPGEMAPSSDSDLLERYLVLQDRQIRPREQISDSAVRAVRRAASQLERITTTIAAAKKKETMGKPPQEGEPEAAEVARLLLSAYPDRLARQREEVSDAYLLSSGRGARLSRKSGVRGGRLILAVQVDAGEKGEGVIHQACRLDEALIREELGDRIASTKNVFWDETQERVFGYLEEAVGAVVLLKRQYPVSDEEAIPVILSRLRNSNFGLLRWEGAPEQLLGRVRVVRNAFPREDWPGLERERIHETLEQLLVPFLSGVRSRRDLASIDLATVLKSSLSWEQLRLLDQRAPTHVTVPSGSRLPIDYQSEERPILAVKLQEMFGLADTPTIAEGRVPILLHLLSPARRPVQVTIDLKGFWETGYKEVKKELKGRYPKHPWPDDPWQALPTAKTNRMLKKV